ncbi:hypothetical protein CUR86_10445 [Salinicola acroporae]|uniref:Uncharacterized protein n=1 Tax=Salinicola acroporae TaxID=1541440 RepID=A0ABT6I582_9GAMM|nr:hypothetical protein [Salinicola acroporae]
MDFAPALALVAVDAGCLDEGESHPGGCGFVAQPASRIDISAAARSLFRDWSRLGDPGMASAESVVIVRIPDVI